jgi:hypothetical protein
MFGWVFGVMVCGVISSSLVLRFRNLLTRARKSNGCANFSSCGPLIDDYAGVSVEAIVGVAVEVFSD